MGQFDDFSAREVRRVIESRGWYLKRSRGSHFVFTHSEHRGTLVLPMHDPVRPGLLRDLIARAGMTTADFLRIAKK